VRDGQEHRCRQRSPVPISKEPDVMHGRSLRSVPVYSNTILVTSHAG